MLVQEISISFLIEAGKKVNKKKMEGEEQVLPAEAHPEWMMRQTSK